MSLADLGKTVAKYAPLLGSVLPIPGGAAIGQAIAAAFGGNADDEQDLIKRINADPEAAVKLLDIQGRNKLELEKLAMQKAYNEQFLDFQNVDSARKREIALAQSGQRDWFMPALAILIIIGFYGAILMIIEVKQDPADNDILYMMLGILGTAFVSVVGYYFGSSASSRKKDDALVSRIAHSV